MIIQESERLVWGEEETEMFHGLKPANLIGPWQGMCDRMVRMFEFEFDSKTEGDVDDAAALAEHIEVLALHRIHSRRIHFHRSFERQRDGRPQRRGNFD